MKIEDYKRYIHICIILLTGLGFLALVDMVFPKNGVFWVLIILLLIVLGSNLDEKFINTKTKEDK